MTIILNRSRSSSSAPTGKLLKGVMKTMAQQPADATTARRLHPEGEISHG
jgi:hypothetical protein